MKCKMYVIKSQNEWTEWASLQRSSQRSSAVCQFVSHLYLPTRKEAKIETRIIYCITVTHKHGSSWITDLAEELRSSEKHHVSLLRTEKYSMFWYIKLFYFKLSIYIKFLIMWPIKEWAHRKLKNRMMDTRLRLSVTFWPSC